jgi:hypothetical protein
MQVQTIFDDLWGLKKHFRHKIDNSYIIWNFNNF